MSKKTVTLTADIILKKAKVPSLNDVQHLNFWGNSLEDVSIISKCPNVETIALSVNNVKTLKPFSNCYKLKELFLRKNDIANLNELYYLRGVNSLQTLWLTDNPLFEKENYRLFCIALLPQITKLDEVDITKDEIQLAKKMFPKPESVVQPPSDLTASTTSSSSKSSTKSSNVTAATQNDAQVRALQAISVLLPILDQSHLDTLQLKISEEKRSRKKE